MKSELVQQNHAEGAEALQQRSRVYRYVFFQEFHLNNALLPMENCGPPLVQMDPLSVNLVGQSEVVELADAACGEFLAGQCH